MTRRIVLTAETRTAEASMTSALVLATETTATSPQAAQPLAAGSMARTRTDWNRAGRSLTAAALGVLTLLMLGGSGQAQETGGLRLSPAAGTGPVGLAQPLPFTYQPLVTAHDLQAQAMPSAADRQQRHQAMITKLRGDPGYLAGFSMGTPLAASRQVPVADDGLGFGFEDGSGPGRGGRGRRPIVINGPVAIAVGNDNVIQQQTASGPGPIAQQQVATVNRNGEPVSGAKSGGAKGAATVAGGGAVNVVTGGGNIIQHAPAP